MNGYKLIYHDKESSTGGVSPFDKTVTEIVRNRSVSIVCPYIGIDYFDRIIRLANTWRLITDVEEWISSHNREARQGIKDFILKNLSAIHHYKDIHAKVIVADDKAFIGSSNLTNKGITGRVEMGVLIESIRKIAPDREWINDYFDLAKEIIEFTGLESDDPRLVMSIRKDKKMGITINQRYILTPSYYGKSTIGLIMNHDYDREYDKQCVHVGKFDPFKEEDKDKTPYWLVFKRNKIEFSEPIKDYWKQAVMTELKRSKNSGFKKFHEPIVYEAVMNLSYRNKLLEEVYHETF